ncbi:MAG: hypothetical protein WDZ79_00665 [Candidatus Paceibacterota bacterium]
MKHSTSNGYALFFAIIVASILAVVGFAVSRVSFQEVRLSTIGEESQKALNASNSGAECAMFWDRREESAFSGGGPGEITCRDDTASQVNSSGVDVYEFTALFGGEQCAMVMVDKSDPDDVNETIIVSRGYNICPIDLATGNYIGPSPRRLERAVEVDYEFDAGLVISEADISLVLDSSDSMDNEDGCQDENGVWLTRMKCMQDAVKGFIDGLGDSVSADGIHVGVTSFGLHGWILTELIHDVDALKGHVDNITTGNLTNMAGGLFLGTDVIVGNTDDLEQYNDNPVPAGRDPATLEKRFIILVSDGDTNRTAVESDEERGKAGGTGNPKDMAEYAADLAKDEDIVIITFGVGVSTGAGSTNEFLREWVASDASDWERCGEFPSGKCHFVVSSFGDLAEVFSAGVIFGTSDINWQPR